MRLTEGDSDADGALQLDTGDGEWTPICKNGFDDDAADVACKQLGYKQSSELSTYQVIRYIDRSCVMHFHRAINLLCSSLFTYTAHP